MMTDEFKLYTTEEVKKILKVTQRTVYNYIKNGDLKAVKVGRRWRVKHQDLKAFLAGETQ